MDNGTIYTVRGPVAGSELGFTLPHEHIMVDFGGGQQQPGSTAIIPAM